MLDDVTANPAQEAPDFDSLLSDLFGLNIRGAKTLRDLFARPKEVFESARVYNWRSKYTPTLRLAFSILTVFSLLSFFWAAEDGVLYQSLLTQFSDVQNNLPDGVTLNDMVDKMFASYNFAYPFTYMLLHSLVGSLLFIWGRDTPWVARLRLYFCVASIGVAIAVASVVVMPLIDQDLFLAYSMAGMALSVLAYAITYARGMTGHFSTFGLYGRTALIAIVVTMTDIIVAILAGTIAGFWSQVQLGV